MTCTVCGKPYKKFPTTCGAPLWKKQCQCKRPMAKCKPGRVYDIRDCWRDEVSR